jgi:hypothetical protein
VGKAHGSFSNAKLPEQIEVGREDAPNAIQEHSAQRHTHHEDQPEDFPNRRLGLRQNTGNTREQKTHPNHYDSHIRHHVGVLNFQKNKVLYKLNHLR